MQIMDKNKAEAWVRNKLDNHQLSIKDLGNSYYNGIGKAAHNAELDPGESVIVEQKNGGEGDGAPLDHVFKVQVNDEMFYFRISGTYSSWDDPMWDDTIEIVEPHEVMITVFEPR